MEAKFRNFNDVLLRNFSGLSGSPALMFKSAGSWDSVTYGELEDICMRVAAGLVRRGLNPGERIAVLANNRPEWAYADLGSLLAGAVSSAIYSTSLADEAEFIINDLEASYLFVEDGAQLEKIMKVRGAIPCVRRVFVFDPPPDLGADGWVEPFANLLAEEPSPEIRDRVLAAARLAKGEDPMCIVYTSGTTGKPKGAVLTHNNYLKTAELIVKAVGDTDRLTLNLSFLPLAHAFERFAGYYLVLYLGRTIAYAEGIDQVARNFQEVRPRFAVCVPRVFEKIHGRIMATVRSSPPWQRKLFDWSMNVALECAAVSRAGGKLTRVMRWKLGAADRLVLAKVRGLFGGRIEFFVSGGAPLSRELAEFFHALGILIIEGWGATEGTTPYSLNTPRQFRFGSVGKALPRVSVRVAADGELEVKGPNIFKGYWRNAEETREAFTPDGYFRTGDIGRIDEEGWIYITDRKKQLIITSAGKNIAPAAVERELLLCPHIEMAYIHGDRRNYLTALVVLDEAETRRTARSFGMEDMPWQELVRDPLVLSRVQEEIDRANGKLPRFMQVKYFRVVPPFSVESGELTPTLKMKKRVIEETYKDILDGMY